MRGAGLFMDNAPPPPEPAPDDIVIVIPGTPAAKGRGRAAVMPDGRARVFTPKKTRTREGIVASLATDAMAGRAPLQGPVMMRLDLVMPVARSWPKWKRAAALSGDLLPTGKPDLSNLWKLVEDALNGITYLDDAQIVQGHQSKSYGAEPRTVITIRPAALAREGV